jgi:hypothetical protein
MIDQREVGQTDDKRDDPIHNRLTHGASSSTRTIVQTQPKLWPRLAGTLNASKPIEKPKTRSACDIENHLANFNFDLTIWCRRRCHRVSFS